MYVCKETCMGCCIFIVCLECDKKFGLFEFLAFFGIIHGSHRTIHLAFDIFFFTI